MCCSLQPSRPPLTPREAFATGAYEQAHRSHPDPGTPLRASSIAQASREYPLPAIGKTCSNAASMWRLGKEFFSFLRQEKKWWLLPLFFILLLLAAVILFGSSSVLAPFMYPFM